MRYDLVIFDNDGVLVDSEPIACDVLAKLLTDCGVPTSFEDVIREFLGGSISRTREISEIRLGRALPDDFEDRFHRVLFERLKTELKAIKHVEQALGEVASSYCVASSGTHERIRLSLSVTRLIDLFDGKVFSASDVERGKPEPDLFLFAATKMGVAPERCVVVEDSPLGIDAAARAGMSSIGYAELQDPEKLREASEGVIGDMRDLQGLLD